MGLFDFFKTKSSIKGEIGYLGLSEWWLSEFSEEERGYIVKTFQPLGSSGECLIKGEISSMSQTAISLLSSLAGWFRDEQHRIIAYKMLKKAEEMLEQAKDVLDIHFFWSTKIEIYYRHRDNDSNALSEAVKACIKQIEIADKAIKAFKKEYRGNPLPTHKGYEQLAIIKEKDKDFNSAIELATKALQQGWGGDWQKRIERCTKKMNK